MSKILDRIKKALSILGEPMMLYEVYLYDTVWDTVTDNDDMEDIPTLIKVVYGNTGKIISKEFVNDRTEPSSYQDINMFKDICKIQSAKDYTMVDKFTLEMYYN